MSVAPPDRGLLRQLQALLNDEDDFTVNTHNFVAALFHELADINWLGIYWLRGEQLVLGPFQGRPACTRIGLGQGVCGTAALERRTVVVPDVSAFAGHIVCDPASRSEIVVPMESGAELLGVLDVDSPILNRFGGDEQAVLESAIQLLMSYR